MIQIHETPALLRWLYPSLTWERVSHNELFLTFDDGPHPSITPWVLEQLDQYNAKATFFGVGENIRKYPEVAQEIAAHGSVIANHSQNHLKGWNTRDAEYVSNIQLCTEQLVELNLSNRLFRPPYGRIKRSQVKVLSPSYEIIMWSHLSWDFASNLNVKRSIRQLKKAGPGSIIVFHDSDKAFKNLQGLLPPLLDHWSSQSFKFAAL